MPEVTKLCNRVIIMHRGRVVMDRALADAIGPKGLDQAFLESVGAVDLSASIPEAEQA